VSFYRKRNGYWNVKEIETSLTLNVIDSMRIMDCIGKSESAWVQAKHVLAFHRLVAGASSQDEKGLLKRSETICSVVATTTTTTTMPQKQSASVVERNRFEQTSCVHVGIVRIEAGRDEIGSRKVTPSSVAFGRGCLVAFIHPSCEHHDIA
jgi:hypothetical protein